MRQTKQWLATAAMLLCGAASVCGQDVTIGKDRENMLVVSGPIRMGISYDRPSPIVFTKDDGLLSTVSVNEESGIPQYEYTSPVITLGGPCNVLYFTFLEGHTTTQYLLDKNGYPFVALAEFQLYDANGKEIRLEAHNLSTNAQERSEGPIANICDGNRSTYFHSTWSSGASGYHQLCVELPDTLSAFSFKYYTRYIGQCVPKKIGVRSEYKYFEHEDFPIELTTNDGLLSTTSVNEKKGIPQYEYTSPVLTLDEPSNVLYFTFLEGFATGQFKLDEGRFPFMALAEFQLYDANGKEIELDARNFSTNAPERTEGPIADICDGDRNTHFHTAWTSRTSDYHYLRVALPDTLSAFSFKYYTRHTGQCVPKRIGIKGECNKDPYAHENPYDQVLAQGTCGEDVSWVLKFGGHLIISGEGDMEIQGYDSPWEEMTVAKVTIEDGVTSIANHAFCNCRTLAWVSIPASVTKIGRDDSYSKDNPFSGCRSLSSIEVDKDNPVYDSRDNCNAIIKTGADALVVGCHMTRIPESVVSIEENAFDGYNQLTRLYIPKSVTTIEQGAFDFCSNLTLIVVAEDNPVYDSRGNCNAIIRTRTNTLVQGCVNTVIPTSVTKIGNEAFSTSSINSIVIPENVVSIGDRAFTFSDLSSVYIPKNVKNINANAFGNCSLLTSIAVDENNEVYDSRNYCNAIIETATNTLIKGCSTTTIPDDITKIGEYAFSRIYNLDSIVIPEDVLEIGDYAFMGCGNLTSVTIPKGVTKIGRAAFMFCYDLASIVIPKSVTEIGVDALEYCDGLTTVTLPKRFKGKEKEIFGNCEKLPKIRFKNK